MPRTERRSSLEIIPCGATATRENKKRRISGQEPRLRREVIGRSVKTRNPFSRSKSYVNEKLNPDYEIADEVGDTVNSPMIPIEVKLECEEIEDQDIAEVGNRKRHREECGVSVSATKKRRYSRRRESLDIPTITCELCEFTCRFVKDVQKHYDEKHSSNKIVCGLCGFKASTLGGLGIHSARKHSVGKNAAKLVEGVERRSEDRPVASDEKTNSANNICDENLVNNAAGSVGRDDPVPLDGTINTMNLECINVEESVKAIVSNERKDHALDNIFIENKSPLSDSTESAKTTSSKLYIGDISKYEDNYDIPISSTEKREAEDTRVDIVKETLQDDSGEKMVENSQYSNVDKSNADCNDEKMSVEFDNGKCCKKNLGQNEEDPLTILKNVKAAHSKERVKRPKGRENKKASTIEVAVAKKDGLGDEKGSGTEDVKTEKTDKTEGGAEDHDEK